MGTNTWFHLGSSDDFSALFGKPISKIRLRQSIDSIQWVVFCDVDLTTKWINYLKTLQVRQLPLLNYQNKINGGVGRVVDIQLDDSIYTFIFTDMAHLMYNNHIYEIKGELNCPFDETYSTAINRNGIVTPWG